MFCEQIEDVLTVPAFIELSSPFQGYGKLLNEVPYSTVLRG